MWAPAKTSDILEQLNQDIDTWYYHETLRNDRGDTQNDDFWYTCLPDFLAQIKSSGTMRDTQKKQWPFQPRPFADIIGLVPCSCVVCVVCLWVHAVDSLCFLCDQFEGLQESKSISCTVSVHLINPNFSGEQCNFPFPIGSMIHVWYIRLHVWWKSPEF